MKNTGIKDREGFEEKTEYDKLLEGHKKQKEKHRDLKMELKSLERLKQQRELKERRDRKIELNKGIRFT